MVSPAGQRGCCAPEDVQTDAQGLRHAKAATTADMWGVGVLAWELLTQQRLFSNETEQRDIVATPLGSAPLPWEQKEQAALLLPRLHALRRSVLRCLSRDPAERPASRELLGHWNGLFEAGRESR